MAKAKTEEEKFPYGKVKLGGKNVRKTKDGFLNLVDLDKDTKKSVKEFIAKKKLEKKEVKLKEVMEVLKGL